MSVQCLVLFLWLSLEDSLAMVRTEASSAVAAAYFCTLPTAMEGGIQIFMNCISITLLWQRATKTEHDEMSSLCDKRCKNCLKKSSN